MYQSMEIDPFKHDLELSWRFKLQVVVMTLTLVPIKLLIILCLTLISWIISSIGLIGIDKLELEKQPFKGWRKKAQNLIYWNFRATLFIFGISNLSVTGKPDVRTRVFVCAPHSTILDMIVIILSHSAPIAKAELANVILMGKIGQFLQCIFVKRENENSRKETRENIKAHIVNAEWRPILIFPEGTNTNAKALIHFKTGAFENGADYGVQPILVRFNNNPDTMRWTWNQRFDAKFCLWLSMCHLYINCEVDFMPYMEPSDRNKENARLWADEIRDIMAEKLEIPTSQKTLADGKLSVSNNNKEEEKDEAKSIDMINDSSVTSIDFLGNMSFIV